MATIDGRPAQYGITLKTLRELMEHRGREGILRIQEQGGIQEICKKLYTSPNEGKYRFSQLYLIDLSFFYLDYRFTQKCCAYIGILSIISL